MAARFAGLILAGGIGERYGGPKAFARTPDGRPFLVACAELLASAGAAPLVATLPAGTPSLQSPDLQGLPLPASGLAMFDSLKLGLEHLLADEAWGAVVVLPVDHPLVAPDSVRALASAEAEAALPSHNGKHGHPVMISRRVAERIVAGELAGPTLREVLRAVGTVDVPVDDPGVTANCNTPEALAAAWAQLGRQRS
jgi:CTP:molybdopterin cytidylyltransferase MocA